MQVLRARNIHEEAEHEEKVLAMLPHVASKGAKFLLTPHFTPEEAPWIYRLEALDFPMEAQAMGMVKLVDFAPIKALLKNRSPEISVDTLEKENSLPELTQIVFSGEDDGEFKPLRLWLWGMDSV